MKPHIRLSRWQPGYVCKSIEPASGRPWYGKLKRSRVTLGLGPTPMAAYLDRYFRRYYSGGFDAGRIPEC